MNSAQPGQSPPLFPEPTATISTGSPEHAKPDTELIPDAGDSRHPTPPDVHDPDDPNVASTMDSNQDLKHHKIDPQTGSLLLGVTSEAHREPSKLRKPVEEATSQLQAEIGIYQPNSESSTSGVARVISGQATTLEYTDPDKSVQSEALTADLGDHGPQQGKFSTSESSMTTDRKGSPPQSVENIHHIISTQLSSLNRAAEQVSASVFEESRTKLADQVASSMRGPAEGDPIRTASIVITSEARQSTHSSRNTGNETTSCCGTNATQTGTQLYFTGAGTALLAKGNLYMIWTILVFWGIQKLPISMYAAL